MLKTSNANELICDCKQDQTYPLDFVVHKEFIFLRPYSSSNMCDRDTKIICDESDLKGVTVGKTRVSTGSSDQKGRLGFVAKTFFSGFAAKKISVERFCISKLTSSNRKVARQIFLILPKDFFAKSFVKDASNVGCQGIRDHHQNERLLAFIVNFDFVLHHNLVQPCLLGMRNNLVHDKIGLRSKWSTKILFPSALPSK